MYRFVSKNFAINVKFTCFRFLSTIINDPSTSNRYGSLAQELVDNIEHDRHERELTVDSRTVIFASASSADQRPRIAAAEAFDIAAAALPRAPNLCYVNVSVDCETMLDAPQVVWTELCKANNTNPATNTSASESSTSSSSSSTSSTESCLSHSSLHMFGGAVSRQRLGRGYVEVLLGCVPDLEVDAFTFDTLPEKDEIHDSTRPPPVLCVASLDSRLALQYENVLSSRLTQLTSTLGHKCPLIGGVYPPIAIRSLNDGITGVKHEHNKNEESNTIANSKSSTSVFFVNNRVYRGSAAAVLLRSRLLQARSINLVPSIAIGNAVMDKITSSEYGMYKTPLHKSNNTNNDQHRHSSPKANETRSDKCNNESHEVETFDAGCSIQIHILNGRPATTVIRELYESDDLRNKPCRIFLGFAHNNARIPTSFIGNPETGTLTCTLPPNVQCRQGDCVYFLVDDVELDTEAAAGLMISMEETLKPISVLKSISVSKEGRCDVTASSTAALHFSYGGLNTQARPSVPVISLDHSETLCMPSLLRRCNGKTCANSGIFCPGQVATVDDVTAIFARSSTYTYLQGLE